MELVMKRPMSFFETLQKLFPQKGENIVYEEEGILGKGISLPSALKQIQRELGIIEANSTLFIIDRYFTLTDGKEKQAKEKQAKEYASQLYDWVEKTGIREVNIYSNPSQTFKDVVTEQFDGRISLHWGESNKDIHDRLWIIKNEQGVHGVMVGSSLSGFGKSFTLVCPIPLKDIDQLAELLRQHGIPI